jgi:hypothetical protein
MWVPLLLLTNRFHRTSSRSFSQGILAVGIMLIAFALTCLPWTAHATRSVRIFNGLAEREPEFESRPFPGRVRRERAFENCRR